MVIYLKDKMKLEDGKMCHIGPDKQPLYEERYDYVYTFNKTNQALVCLDDKWFHIDRNGKPLYEERYDHIISDIDSNGTFIATIGNHRCHVKLDGKPLYDKRFMVVSPFDENGIALGILDDNTTIHINSNGEYVNL